MSYILVDENNKVLSCMWGDGSYYSMVSGDIPTNALLFDDNDQIYNDMIKFDEQIIEDCNNGDTIDLTKLKKVQITRK